MLRRIRIAGSRITTFQDYDRGPGEPVAYDNSDVVTDFRLVLCDIQASNELHGSTPNGQLSNPFAKFSELTSGANYGKGTVSGQLNPSV